MLTLLQKNSRKPTMLQRRHKKMQTKLQRNLPTQLKKIQLTLRLLIFKQVQTLLKLMRMLKLPPETLLNPKMMQQRVHWKV